MRVTAFWEIVLRWGIRPYIKEDEEEGTCMVPGNGQGFVNT